MPPRLLSRFNGDLYCQYCKNPLIHLILFFSHLKLGRSGIRSKSSISSERSNATHPQNPLADILHLLIGSHPSFDRDVAHWAP